MVDYIVIANRGQYNHRIYRRVKYLGEDVKMVQNTITPEDIEKEEPEGIIIGGGPYLDEVGNTPEILKKFYKEVPILGICLGLQLIAKEFGGTIKEADVGEYAEAEIIVDEENEILKGLSPGFKAWVSHMDEVKKLPENFRLLAHSATCEIEAAAHNKYPVYGVQFHPEVEHTPIGEEIFKNFIELCKRI
ncbi:GMP synthase [glutamine-hydrolyzing] [archaeon BMS3Bbin15]|nr:GMP synthase [glutamine-hydrolyzing] [archaeon BMS3Bbin15]